MTAAVYNIEMAQGSNYQKEFQLLTDNVPRPLMGYEVRGQMRTHKKSPDIAATFTCVVTDEADGRFSIAITKIARDALKEGTYVYDIELFTLDEEDVDRVLEGSVTVIEGVTR
jgi:hypothetical protein